MYSTYLVNCTDIANTPHVQHVGYSAVRWILCRLLTSIQISPYSRNEKSVHNNKYVHIDSMYRIISHHIVLYPPILYHVLSTYIAFHYVVCRGRKKRGWGDRKRSRCVLCMSVVCRSLEGWDEMIVGQSCWFDCESSSTTIYSSLHSMYGAVSQEFPESWFFLLRKKLYVGWRG